MANNYGSFAWSFPNQYDKRGRCFSDYKLGKIAVHPMIDGLLVIPIEINPSGRGSRGGYIYFDRLYPVEFGDIKLAELGDDHDWSH